MDNSKARERLEKLFDGEFCELDAFAKSAEGDVEVVAGYGIAGGKTIYAFSQNIDVNAGAVTVAHCAKIKKIYDLALKTGSPVVGIYDSNGVKITEGFEVLSAYGELVKASARLSGVVPQISVIAGACVGTSALIANLADVVIAVKDADFYVTAPSEVAVEDSAKNGVVDITADDYSSAALCARELISLLPENNLSLGDFSEYSAPAVQTSADLDTKGLLNSVADAESLVYFKDEYSDGVSTALGKIMGLTVGFAAFGDETLSPKALYKAETFVKLCDAFEIPIITIADSKGLQKDCEAQLLTALTKLTSAYASATCPKISLITKEAVGASYIVLAGKGASSDLTFAWDTAVASPLDVDSAVAFLFSERLAKGEIRAELVKEYKGTIGSAYTAAACGAVDDVFTPEKTREKLEQALAMLSGKREATLPRKHSVK